MTLALVFVAVILAIVAWIVLVEGKTTAATVIGSMALIAIAAAMVRNLLHR